MATQEDYLRSMAERNYITLDFIITGNEEPILIDHSFRNSDYFTSNEWEALASGNQSVQTKQGCYVKDSCKEVVVGEDMRGFHPYRGKTLRRVCYRHVSIMRRD